MFLLKLNLKQKLVSLFVICLILSLTLINVEKTSVKVSATTLDTQINSLQNKLNNTIGQFNESRKRKADLEEEKKVLLAQIDEVNGLLVESEKIAKELKSNLETLKKELEDLENERKEMMLEIQRMSLVSPVQDLIASRNFGEAMSKVYLQSTIENSLRQLITQKEEKQEQLNNALKKQEENQKLLEDTKLAKLGKQQELDMLISQYAGNLAKYAEEVARVQKEIDAANAKAKEIEDNPQPPVTNTPNPPSNDRGNNTTRVGPLGCRFEDSRNYDFPGDFFGRPTAGLKTQSFGCPSSAGINHDGVDISAPCGTEVFSAGQGVVASKGSYNVAGFGNWVMILHTSPSGKRVYALYAHLRDPSFVGIGASIARGQLIGYMGATGWASGCHLHHMFYSDNFEGSGHGCVYGSSKCVRPERFIGY